MKTRRSTSPLVTISGEEAEVVEPVKVGTEMKVQIQMLHEVRVYYKSVIFSSDRFPFIVIIRFFASRFLGNKKLKC